MWVTKMGWLHYTRQNNLPSKDRRGWLQNITVGRSFGLSFAIYCVLSLLLAGLNNFDPGNRRYQKPPLLIEGVFSASHFCLEKVYRGIREKGMQETLLAWLALRRLAFPSVRVMVINCRIPHSGGKLHHPVHGSRAQSPGWLIVAAKLLLGLLRVFCDSTNQAGHIR